MTSNTIPNVPSTCSPSYQDILQMMSCTLVVFKTKERPRWSSILDHVSRILHVSPMYFSTFNAIAVAQIFCCTIHHIDKIRYVDVDFEEMRLYLSIISVSHGLSRDPVDFHFDQKVLQEFLSNSFLSFLLLHHLLLS